MRLTSLEEMTDLSKVVVRGRVTDLETRAVDGGRLLFTVLTLSSSDVLKGEAAGTLEVVVPGGAHDGMMQRVGGMPLFADGDEVVLFLKRRMPAEASGGRERFAVVSMALGAFWVEEERAVRRAEGLRVITGPLDKPRPLEVDEREMSIVELEARVRNAADRVR